MAQLLGSLATFGAGFGVRPLGAIVFGHIGDFVGRGNTPSSSRWRPWASRRPRRLSSQLCDGRAVGDDSPGASAAAPGPRAGRRVRRRGDLHRRARARCEAWLLHELHPDHGHLGILLEHGGHRDDRIAVGEAAFKLYGWRVPFLLSFVLLGVSLYIRLKMRESPLFQKLKASGQVSTNPSRESFMQAANVRYILIALFGATAGQGVVWYTGQFYALTFLQKSLGIGWQSAYLMMSCALLVTSPLFVFFGWLSDRMVGRASCSGAAPWRGSPTCRSTSG